MYASLKPSESLRLPTPYQQKHSEVWGIGLKSGCTSRKPLRASRAGHCKNGWKKRQMKLRESEMVNQHIWLKYLNLEQVFSSIFYQWKDRVSELWLTLNVQRASCLQPIRIPLGHSAQSSLCISMLGGATSQLFLPSYKTFQNLEEDLPMSFWKPRETLDSS